MILLLLACERPPAPPPLRVEQGRLLDASDREVLLRGVNARVEGIFDVSFDDGREPLEPIPAFGAADCRFVAEELGLNLLRLPIDWSAIEPERDVFDEAYLDRVFALVDDCAAVGVVTLVDLHQDAYSKEIGEDGAPLWAIVPPPDELLGGPLEDLDARRRSPQVLRAFASLYADADGLHAEYAAMAAHVAARFPDHPGAVALEIHNEPVTLGDQGGLDALHAAVADAVDALVAFEPDALRNLTDEAIVADFPEPAIYAPHLYTDVFEGQFADAPKIAASVSAARVEANGAALLFGEFGHDPKDPRGVAWTAAALDAMDAERASWAFWLYEEESQGHWGLFEGDEVRDVADVLARPFPAAVSGRLMALSWDGALRFTVDGGGEHVVTVPRRTFPAGARVTCDGAEVEAAVAVGRATFACGGGEVVVAPR